MPISKLLTVVGCGTTVIHHQDCKSNPDECYRFTSNMTANTSRYIYTEPHHSFMLQITFTVIPENHKSLINSCSTTDEFIFVCFIQLQIAYNCRSPCRGTFQSGGGRGTVCELLKNCQALLSCFSKKSLASVCPWEQFFSILFE